MAVWLVVREINKTASSGFAVILGAWADQGKAEEFAKKQDDRHSLQVAAKTLGAIIRHYVVPLEIET